MLPQERKVWVLTEAVKTRRMSEEWYCDGGATRRIYEALSEPKSRSSRFKSKTIASTYSMARDCVRLGREC